jgi:hypothetical protein
VYAFLAIEVGTRHVHVPGVTTNPDRPQTAQTTRNLPTDLGEHADRFGVPPGDRAGQLTSTFDAILTAAGSAVSTTPARCPRANTHAARRVRTLPGELTDRMLILGPTTPAPRPDRIRAALQPEAAAPGHEPVTTTPTSHRHRP